MLSWLLDRTYNRLDALWIAVFAFGIGRGQFLGAIAVLVLGAGLSGYLEGSMRKRNSRNG